MKEMDGLKEQVMMNQFMFATGCPLDQAKHFLTQAKWQFESALSMFFQETSISTCRTCNGNHASGNYSLCAPANTPCTPPNFPEALMALSKLSTAEKYNNSSYASSPPQVSHSPAMEIKAQR